MELETDELPPYKLEFTALRKGNITEEHGIKLIRSVLCLPKNRPSEV